MAGVTTLSRRDCHAMSRRDRGRDTPTPPKGVVGCHDHLSLIADRLERLSVSRHDPEQFFVERSELVHELRAIAGRWR